MNNSPGLKTPIRAPRTASHKAPQFRDSLVERSPTLVGDSPPPLLRTTTPSSAGVNLSQMTASFDETPAESASCDVSISSTISTRRKPICRKCKTPRKGHKGGQCPIAVSDDGRSLYAASSENERSTSAKTIAKSECPVEGSTSSITTTCSSVSVGGKRKQPQCRKCGFPMKGHKRPNGILQCPSSSGSFDWDSNASAPPTPSKPKRLNTDHPTPTPPPQLASEVSSADIKRGRSPDRSVPMNSSAGHITASASRRYRRNITPTLFALSEHRSSFTPTKPIAYPSRSLQQDSENDRKPSHRRFSHHSPSPSSSAPTASDHMPLQGPASQFHQPESSFDSLRQALGEPELSIYPACDRGEAARIRDKAKELKYFSGVINVGTQGCDDMRIDSQVTSRAHNAATKEADVKEECRSYIKWVLISKKEDIVRRCTDIYQKYFTGV
ncbi:hypothetical protein F5887DRAFT_965814 [Amanita rubescens]|nr:hypothetical protein F5887DRAFT_965814 [Amanita rubescens]